MNTVIALISLIPVLLDAIEAIEKKFPLAGKGKEKLEAVKKILNLVPEEDSLDITLIEKTIGVLVWLYNTLGIFKKSS